MIRFVIAACMVSAAVAAAPPALADPNILLPDCSSGQNPEPGACKPEDTDVYVDDAPGANPTLPLGLNPQSVPVV